MGRKGYLILENGQVFEGDSFGYEKEIYGEVVFNTGMVGYPESFTDSSYYGQILTMTYPLIGNYGVPPLTSANGISSYLESEKIQIRGLIVSSYTEHYKHWQAQSDLSTWLKKDRIPALSGIDTRSLTKIIREKGVMKGAITFQKPRNLSGFSFYDINRENLVQYVSSKKISTYGKGKLKVVLIDCGLKFNQIRMLLKHDTTVIRVPWNFNPYKDSKFKFDAVFVSNGPGDARNMPETIAIVREGFNRKIPTFGICLGHQILALASGGNIFKLKYGHRSQNQPVIDEFTRKCYVTSQNHGFSVIPNSIQSDWKIWFTNLNDKTNEGIHHNKYPFFSVQFHPEATAGPTDSAWLFDYFIDKTKEWLKTN